MKPSPYLVSRALASLHAKPQLAVLVGDSVAEVEAALAIDVRVVGYANRLGKSETLLAAGADAIVTDMLALH